MSDFMCFNGVWNCVTVPCQRQSCPGQIPAALAEEAYREYAARYGTAQSFGRLHERGGFGIDELAILLFYRIKRLETELAEEVW